MTHSLVLADIPERVRLRELTASLDARRDEIAEHDLEIELLRATLASFEHGYNERLRGEHAALWRIESLIRHLERWANTVREAYQHAGKERERVLKRAEHFEERRQRELEDMREAADTAPPPPVPEQSQTHAVALKKAYRALARRYHPDLARTESERLFFSDTMTRINEWYHLGDLERLERLAEQAKGGEIDDGESEISEQVEALQKRLRWFDKVLANLQHERRQLERSKTCELMRNVEQAEQMGRDLVAEIQAELEERAQSGQAQIRDALRFMEKEVTEYNKRSTGGDLVKPIMALEKRFDPFADKQLVRLGLEELSTMRTSREGVELSKWLVEVAQTHPPLLRAVLLSYVCDLSPYPLPGFESFDDVQARFLALQDDDGWSLEKALVEGDQVIHYGVKQASSSVVHMGLGLRSDLVREAVLIALKQFAIRREFRRVLAVLGEREHCVACGKDVYSVPLFRTRGLDDFRALVCPSCGVTFRSYWMPRGEDVQGVLNAAFIDFEMVSEWSIRWGRASVAVQLAESELDSATVGDLKKRIHADILKRNDIDVTLAQITLEQNDKRVPEKKALQSITGNTFTLRFSADAPVREAEALELVKHRIRTRFSSSG